jgi:signal transduction histidine kinase
LTSSINELLDRIQHALEREKQFTSDASHQLRTPLAVLKGTLEVLVRKPRTESEYQEKINFSITEIDRISEIVNQLLLLARFDKSSESISSKVIDLHIIIDDILQRFKDKILSKNLSIEMDVKKPSSVYSDPYYVDLIIENIISNAIKYSHQNGRIEIKIFSIDNEIKCQINDFGIGINSSDLASIFNPFFRSDELSHKEIKGNGLGLSIVKKASKVINAKVDVESQINKGSSFTISFSK